MKEQAVESIFEIWKNHSGLAENLEARPELARTCFELGKCLMDIKSRRKILGSKNAANTC